MAEVKKNVQRELDPTVLASTDLEELPPKRHRQAI